MLRLIRVVVLLTALAPCARSAKVWSDESPPDLGREVAIPQHLRDDEEFTLSPVDLAEWGRKLFVANWTAQEGAGRPLTKGNGRALSDPTSALVGRRAFNRISGPDANSCAGCHNAPFGIAGGGGDFVGNVFVLGQRFDSVTFDRNDRVPTRGAVDERSEDVTLDTIANQRSTPGMFGAGYIEMLAREITEDLQRVRDGMRRGDSRILESKGINFGRLSRRPDGMWDASEVVGLPRASILTATPQDPPKLIIRPWHQAGNVVSLREFSNTAMNQHHGIQASERFGVGTDPDGDQFVNEMTRADVTAISIYQAVLPVPGQVLPSDERVRRAIVHGEEVFAEIGCASCHIPALPLSRRNWVYTEPNPFNPPMNLREGEVRSVRVDLTDPALPQPRLVPDTPTADTLMVPLYSDLKLHDITDASVDEEREPLDMNQNTWSPKFVGGNRKFLTKRLWGCANEPPYFHHGLFTTLRDAVMAHAGEALASREAFEKLPPYDQDSLIEFLKSLRVFPPSNPAEVSTGG